MRNPAPAGGVDVPAQDLVTPPPMPSIAASALLETRLLVDGARRAHLVNVADIDWIESDRNYVVLHCGDQEHVVRATLTAFLGRLNPDDFSRISRSAGRS